MVFADYELMESGQHGVGKDGRYFQMMISFALG